MATLLIFLLPPLAWACGMTTHQIIAHRALLALYDPVEDSSMRGLLEEQRDSVFAGSPFPGERLGMQACIWHTRSFTSDEFF